jgi:two-component sensor histidine kinase
VNERSQGGRRHTRLEPVGDEASLVRWFAFDGALAASVRPVHVIVEKIAQALAADCVFVGEPIEAAPDTARTIACWKEGRSVENVTYPAVSTPCEEIRPGSVVRHPLTGLGGALLGHIGVVSRRRLSNERRVRRVLASCAPRVAGEIERLRREQIRERLGAGATLQAASREHDLLQSLCEEGDARMSTLALIHAHSCESPNGAWVDMRAFIEELVANVRRTCVGPTEVVTRLRVDKLDLQLHLATPFCLLISELITNAFQHAFVGVAPGIIDITLTSQGHDVALTVRDNGVGLPHEGEETKGSGLRLVRLLATRQLRGRLFISARQGTEVIVRFPMSPPPRPALHRPR